MHLEVVEVPLSAPDEVRISVKAIGMNREESMFRAGYHDEQPMFPDRCTVRREQRGDRRYFQTCWSRTRNRTDQWWSGRFHWRYSDQGRQWCGDRRCRCIWRPGSSGIISGASDCHSREQYWHHGWLMELLRAHASIRLPRRGWRAMLFKATATDEKALIAGHISRLIFVHRVRQRGR